MKIKCPNSWCKDGKTPDKHPTDVDLVDCSICRGKGEIDPNEPEVKTRIKERLTLLERLSVILAK